MRNKRLQRKVSTKAERIFAERLKRHRIPFLAKVIIDGREVDFLVGKYAIDIDGHTQDGDKNVMLVENGYIPLHINNNEVKTISIHTLCHTQTSQMG